MAGFGALAFVSFRPVAAFGTVLGVGLPSGCLAAFAMRGLAAVPDDDGSVEKAASPLGMEIVWLCYRVFGLGAMRLVARFAAGCVWAFSPSVRKASPSFWKLMMFARSLADKIAVASGRGSLPRIRDDGSEDARAFAADVLSGRGVFVVSSHCGTVEALLALADRPPVFHAWTDIARTSAFNAFYLKHADMGRISLHSISDIGMDTAFEAAEWLEKGECLVMAGDRGTGAFRFAAALGHPVYFAACIADGPGYVAVVRRLHGGAKEMQGMFDEILGELAGKHPEQVYEWNNR
jgi:predicted LPLAT superfamily acyltransferase